MNTIKFLVMLFLLLSVVAMAQAAQIRVSVDRNPVNLNESFQILFTAEESPDGTPDFSALERDFTILNQQHSSHSSWVNGKSSKTIQWTLNVIAKKSGAVTIPAIAFGGDLTDPLTIEVSENTDNAVTQTDSDLFLEVSVSPEQPYLQSQVIYTLRLFRRVDIAQAQLTEPELHDAVVTKLDEDRNFVAQINGVDYSVIERKFAIFPQKSGELKIKPLVLTAEVLTHSGSGFNGFFRSTQTKRVTSKEIILNVKPAPTSFTGAHWLAAEQLDIQQAWSGDFSQMKVGEPLTRTLTLQAKATTVGSLPELSSSVPEQLKTYADQPILKEQKTADGLVALREEKIAIIPSKAGSYTLPEIKIPWFNTKTNTVEVATIPETTINVIANAAAVTEPTPTSKPQEVAAPPVAEQVEQPSLSNWFWVSLVLFLLWLISLFYIFTRLPKQQKPVLLMSDDVVESDLKTCIEQLRKACANDDAVAAKNALLAWGKLKYEVCSLGSLANYCDARLRDELLQLNQMLYSKTSKNWQGKKLFQAFSENNARAKITVLKQESLEPLYRL